MFWFGIQTSLKVAGLCGYDWKDAMADAIGIEPVTSPWLVSQTDSAFDFYKSASICDVFAVNLHGFFNQTTYAGQASKSIGPTAMSEQDIMEHDWTNTVVFLEVCFSAADTFANSLIPQAFYERGAKAVIGSTTEAYGRANPRWTLPFFDGEADRLLKFFLYAYSHDQTVEKSLQYAKFMLKMFSWPLDKDDKATLDSFTIIRRKPNEKKMV